MELVNRLNTDTRAAPASPDVAAKLAAMGSTRVEGSPEEFSLFISKKIPLWEILVKKYGARVS